MMCAIKLDFMSDAGREKTENQRRTIFRKWLGIGTSKFYDWRQTLRASQ